MRARLRHIVSCIAVMLVVALQLYTATMTQHRVLHAAQSTTPAQTMGHGHDHGPTSVMVIADDTPSQAAPTLQVRDGADTPAHHHHTGDTPLGLVDLTAALATLSDNAAILAAVRSARLTTADLAPPTAPPRRTRLIA